MSGMSLRLVYDADAPGPPPHSGDALDRLDSVDQLVPALRQWLREGRDGELQLHGAGSACVCLFEGRVAWVRVREYPCNLGDVMRDELGVSQVALRQAIAHCRATGTRLAEGLLSLSLVTSAELRDCLRRHLTENLADLLAWSGPVTVEHGLWPHRYDHTYTFELDELLASPPTVSEHERERLTMVLDECRQRIAKLSLACIIEVEHGLLLHSHTNPEDDARAAEELLSLCTANLRRLTQNRVTSRDDPPEAMLLAEADGSSLVIQPLPWRPNWMLVLGGKAQLGRLLAVATAATAP
ncbi:MAG: hypothetical protein AAGF11_41190 [Myxococcota bacterium]